jgi:hypothetical protein
MVPASGPSTHDDLDVYRVGSLPEALSVFMLDNRAA